MKLNELALNTNWNRQASNKDAEISGVFMGDLLSYVMGHALEGQVWITMQNHINSIGVASLKDLSAIILIDGLEFEEQDLIKALDNDVAVFISPLNAVETLRHLIQLGL